MDTEHLNQFIAREDLCAWASTIGFTIENVWDGDKPFVPLSKPIYFEDGRRYEHLGTPSQSVCLLSKPS